MLSVQSPLQLAMPNDSLHDDGHSAWNAWRAPTNLPTPPSSVPPRRLAASKPHYAADHDSQQRTTGVAGGVERGHNQHLTLPPIAHLDRHWPNSSPLTPPDDEMHTSTLSLSIWRDSKPGPSRLHSPMTANPSPLLASPSPSPVDEDEQYYERYDAMDDQTDEDDELVNSEWEWDWQRQQQVGGMDSHGSGDQSEYSRKQRQSPEADTNDACVPAISAADWVTNPSHRSAHFIAEKTCEMVCYLWFSSSLGPRAAAASRARRERERSQRRRAMDASMYHGPSHSPPFASRPLSNASTAALQFCASPEFVAFMAKLLATTQVSQSVIVLSLHYIFRLKERNDFALGKPGSEFRVAVCALMLANKFVDDNTYTNKTWSDVSAIPLDELNKMEREFLLGVGFCLFVDAQTYDAWLNLLKGLVLAKEREFNRWRERRRARVTIPRVRIPDARERTRIEAQHQYQHQQQRARSTSPHQSRTYAYAPAYPFTFTVPSSSTAHLQPTSQAYASPNRPASSKRTAADAFSPTSATFAGASRGGKRPTGLALDIPAALASASTSGSNERAWERAGSASAQPAYSYADSLHGLEKMSLATPTERQARTDPREEIPAGEVQRHEREEQTLAAPYRVADAAHRALPPHLYFYTLASSPLGSPYAAHANTYAHPQALTPYAPASGADASSIEGQSVLKEEMPVLPPGAERKARLRYVDSQIGDWYGYEHGSHGYHHATAQDQGQGQVLYNVHRRHGAYHPAPTSMTAHASIGAYTQPHPQPHVPQSVAVAQQSQGQHMQQLPPLAIALSMPPGPARAQISQARSACASPLPSLASLDAYTSPPVILSQVHGHVHVHSQSQEREEALSQVQHAYDASQAIAARSHLCPSSAYVHARVSAPAPAAPSSMSAPPSEMVDGVYAPLPRYVHPHSQSHSSNPPHNTHQWHPERLQSSASMPYKAHVQSSPHTYLTQPQQHDVVQDATATGYAPDSAYPSHAQSVPERAAFANAGPPGVAHFCPYARSVVASGFGGSYDANSTSGGLAVSDTVQQSQSVTASPDAPYVYDYEYSMRGRRL